MRLESAPKEGEAVPLAGNESGPASEQEAALPPKPALKIPPILLEGDEPLPLAAPPAGPHHKFELKPPPAAGAQPPDPLPSQPNELPESYGTGRLLVTARDPHSVYVHWDLGLEDQRRHIASSRGGHLSVRLQAEPPTERPADEVQVAADARHAFVQVARAGTTYAAELGYYRQDGQWQKIAGPESVPTPPETASRETTVRFAAFPEGFPWRPETGPAGAGVRAPAVLKVEGTPGVARAPTPSPVGFVRSAVQERDAANRDEVVEAANPGRWGTAQENALAELLGPILMRSISLSSAEIAELVRGRRPTEVVSMLEGFALAGAGISSPLGPHEQLQRGFWLNVNAELIVYGATEPDALVTIGGQPIQLRPDGTFSLRFALPDGIHGLAVAAASVRGEHRQARLEFRRTTTYEG
jgi:hypothetical protein